MILNKVRDQSCGGTLLKSLLPGWHTAYICSYVVFMIISANRIWCPSCYGNEETWMLEEACTIRQEQALPWQKCTTGWVSKAHKERDTDLEWKACFPAAKCAREMLSSLLLRDELRGGECNFPQRPATNETQFEHGCNILRYKMTWKHLRVGHWSCTFLFFISTMEQISATLEDIPQ